MEHNLGASIHIDHWLVIDAKLKSGRRLMVGIDGEMGLPVEGFLRLYSVDLGGAVQLLRSLGDVLALVDQVPSAKAGRELLMLETSPDTHFLFPGSRYLDVKPVRVLRMPGDVLESALNRLGYRDAVMNVFDDTFELERDLVQLGRTNATLCRRRERLSRAGEHRVISERDLGMLHAFEVLTDLYE